MKVDIQIEHSVSEAIGEIGSRLRDAADAAVVSSTNHLKNDMREVIDRGLGSRASYALRSDFYFGKRMEVVGFVYSAWWRTAADGLDKIDMLAAFERGGLIGSPFGGALAVPLPAAYNALGLPAYSWRGRAPGNKQVTPQAIELALGQRLGIIKTRAGRLLLVARDVVRSFSSRATVRSATLIDRRGRQRRRRGTAAAMVPMFVLLRGTALPKRVDFRAIRATAPQRLAENFLVELAKRDL